MEDVVQSERSAVFNFVRTELEESVEDLSDAHSNLTGEYYGRITKPVAYFLLAKLALMQKSMQMTIGRTVPNWMERISNLQ